MEHQHHFGDSIDIKDVFWDYVNLVEFLICSGHLSPDIGTAWPACRDNNNYYYYKNNNNKTQKFLPVFDIARIWKLLQDNSNVIRSRVLTDQAMFYHVL